MSQKGERALSGFPLRAVMRAAADRWIVLRGLSERSPLVAVLLTKRRHGVEECLMPLNIVALIAILSLPLVPTFWAILDIPKRRFASPRKKAVWFAIVSTFPFIGAMIYIILIRRHTEPIS
ncbi:hypothetical protein Sfum_0159 [Syntrophobacter fumaroxidans MPOB]|uniref:Cardiolipin synthase N-terminal domain-containing protein n=2 Tax=Syntrophobacter TaxID=29526 RepID=A0LEK9_SYNFM|nr:hypothetical protein Sfum_0159 [Syntrophobacter fumaroxidans MPOB]